MRTAAFLISALWCATVCGQCVVYEMPTQCGPGGCCPQPIFYTPRYQPVPQQLPNKPPFQVCPPNAPTPPQTPPQTKPPEPDVDWDALDKKRELEINNLRIEMTNIKQEVSQIGECNCGEKWTAIEKRLVALESSRPQPPASKPLDYDVIAAEVAKRLPPIHFRVQDPRGGNYSTDYQPAKLGSYVTLPFGPAKP